MHINVTINVYFRFQQDVENYDLETPKSRSQVHNIDEDHQQVKNPSLSSSSMSCMKRNITEKKKKKKKQLLRVFSEDYYELSTLLHQKILDPRGSFVQIWNRVFLIASLISLFIDPLFFYMPSVKEEICMVRSIPLEVVLTVIRSVVDAFYVVQIAVRFRTAYVAPSSRVFGRGELVIDSWKIASRYLRKDFWLDFLAALPVPQVLIWALIPILRGSNKISAKNLLRCTIILQFHLRLILIFPLSSQIIKTAGVIVGAAWAGAAYNLLLYMLASHVIGSCWYLLSIERQEQCWKKVCDLHQQPECQYRYFDCGRMYDPDRVRWFLSSNISRLCAPENGGFFNYGIYADALVYKVASSDFVNKFSYCVWWGLRNLSSLGQNLFTSTYVGEIDFAIAIAIVGLVLFALLIGNMQTYLQSHGQRLEEWRVRRTDTEQWMHHRQLPHDLKERVRKYDLYNWVTTRGVNEEAILKGLPLDLRRDIKRHLCLELVRGVPLFDQMDECTLDAICLRLKPLLYTPGTCLVREGDPVSEMVFIIRGHLDSYTTCGGRTGFFNLSRLSPGDFCGEELLTWALNPRPGIILPSSTRTVTAITEVEAFALVSDDVKFVASQFRKLHSKKLRHTFRYHSHQWRTWAACFIQAAWYRYKRRKQAAELRLKENMDHDYDEESGGDDCDGYHDNDLSPSETVAHRSRSYPPRASKFVRYSTTLTPRRNAMELDFVRALQKPVDPDFSVEDQ
ncbi:OLC1v1030776C1 [Oldenlandia corymbosa var. corymbosa]|uniref:OLC1v1030776C1 n=1 Tax=Oldenlandia corymbosa var. corymbosa TaxID=529605 RepID=A0AAV1CGV4_OLDCO|nr:OLC1v1030776C1 [Oldenlandia corymbosa var. corymbosa]